MSTRKKRYTIEDIQRGRDPTASVDNKDFYFGRIYSGMLKSEPFRKLSQGARYFYLVCRAHAQTEEARRCLYKHGNESGEKYDVQRDFVFPASHLKAYGFDPSNAGKYIDVLCKAGFLKKKEENRNLRKVNVYSFSENWKT